MWRDFKIYILLTIVTLAYASLYGQRLKEINKSLSWSDSLTNTKEIRIYNRLARSNYTKIFRMCQSNTKEWQIEWIQHFGNIPNKAELKIIKHKLKSKNEIEQVWLDILKTNIQDLPNMRDIDWKLKQEPEIYEIDGEKKLFWPRTDIMDGEYLIVQFRKDINVNHIVYSNPEAYLEIHPNVDELIYFHELLDVIRGEFGIWND